MQDVQLILGYGEKFTPQGSHLVPVDAAGTGEQFLGVDHVGGTDGMHVDGGALARPPPCRTGMVQVDMRQKNVGDLVGGESVLCQGLAEVGDGGSGAAFHQGGAILVGEEKYADGIGDALEVQVEGVDNWEGHGRTFDGMALMDNFSNVIQVVFDRS